MYRTLDPQKLIETTGQIRDRIRERFPNSGLGKVSEELLEIAHQAVERAHWIGRPNYPLRVLVGVLILAIPVVLVGAFAGLRAADVSSFSSFADLIQGMDAAANVTVLLGAGIFFLVTLEIRIKRKQALKMLHELRVLAHIVDIHQLTKDPERVLTVERKDTDSSPVRTMTAFELSRYLDYCSEMLSLIGKIAALYAQYFDDAAVLEAVDQIEDLSTGLSRKIWQKIMILHRTQSL